MASVFDTCEIAGLRLQSRFVRSATAERMPPTSRANGAKLGAMYAALARGGVGMVVTGHIAVTSNGRQGLLMAGAYDARQLEGWHEAATVAHEADAVLVAQMNHVGGRCGPEVDTSPLCVSQLPEREKDKMRGEEMTDADIEGLIAAFRRAAVRLKDAGMDGVQIHAAHGYLGTQFLSPTTNRRQDKWGGAIEGRARFLRRVVQEVRQAVGPDFPIGMKLGASDDDPSGLTVEDSLQAAKWFEEDGLDFIEISGGFRSDIAKRKIKPGADEGYYAPIAHRFKEALSIPVIAVAGFRSVEAMDAALNNGSCDAIALCRPLIRQPDLPNILRADGKCECVSCGLCMLKNDVPTACHNKARQKAKATTQE